MTDQYQPININRTLARQVSQANVDSTLAVPAVVLGADDGYVFVTDDPNIGGAFQLNLPNISEIPGRQIIIKVDPTMPIGSVPITVNTQAGSGQTIEGGTPTLIPGANNIYIVQATPGSTEWSVIQSPASP